MGGPDLVTRALRALAVWALQKVRDRLTPNERQKLIAEVQDRMLRESALTERSRLPQAKRASKKLSPGLTPRDQARALVRDVEAGLQQIERSRVYAACANLSDLVRIHERTVDPASFTARAGDPRPLVVGPWLMEVGFELLYWIPYLRNEISKLGIPREQVIAISRGGAEPWYQDLAGRYLDILDVMTAEEFREWTSGEGAATGLMDGNRKPFTAGPFETRILERVLGPAGITDFQVIMPSAMYALLRNVWRSRFGAHRLNRHLLPTLLASPELTLELPFDGPYAAVKLYHSLTFPESPATKALAQRLVRLLARRTNVVILSNPARLDDHDTLHLHAKTSRFHIFDASTAYTPRNNLAVQTALVAGAEALHCTYGGFSYLAPLLGVDAFAYTDNFDFTFTHLDLAWQSFEKLEAGRLALIPVGHAALAMMESPEPKRVALADGVA